MTASLAHPEDVARSFVAAINVQDPDTLAELMTDDHVFVDSLGTRVSGRETTRSGWSGYFRMVPDYEVMVEELICSGDVVVLLGSASGTYSTDGHLLSDNRWQTPLAVRARIRGPHVASWQVYADNDALRKLIERSG